MFEQYLLAIGAAREAIYIESQAIPIPPVARALEEALKRGSRSSSWCRPSHLVHRPEAVWDGNWSRAVAQPLDMVGDLGPDPP